MRAGIFIDSSSDLPSQARKPPGADGLLRSCVLDRPPGRASPCESWKGRNRTAMKRMMLAPLRKIELEDSDEYLGNAESSHGEQ